MDILLALISLLLVAGGGSRHANLVVGAVALPSATAMAYWQTQLPNSPVPQAILDLLTPTADDKTNADIKNIHMDNNDKISSSNEHKFSNGPRKLGPRFEGRLKMQKYGPHEEQQMEKLPSLHGFEDQNEVTFAYEPYVEDNKKKITLLYGLHAKEDLKTVSYRPHIEEDLKTVSYRPHIEEDLKTVSYRPHTEEDLKTVSYRPHIEEDLETVSYRPHTEEDLKTVSYRPHTEEDLKTVSYRPNSEEDLKTVSYIPHTEEDLKTVSYRPHTEEDLKTISYRPHIEEDLKTVSYRPHIEEDLKTVSYRPHTEEDLKTVLYRPHIEEDLKTISYRSHTEEDEKKVTLSYGPQFDENQKVTFSYMPQVEEDQKKVTLLYKPDVEEDQKKVTFAYGVDAEKGQKKVTFSYGPHIEEDQKKVTFLYEPYVKEDEKRVTFSYNPVTEENQKVTFSYKPYAQEEQKKIIVSYMPQPEDHQKKLTISYMPQPEDDQKKVTISYMPQHEEDHKKATISSMPQPEYGQKKVTFSYEPQTEDEQKITFSYVPHANEKQKLPFFSNGLPHESKKRSITNDKGVREGHDQHFHGNTGRDVADVFFLEDFLTVGSMITPTIPPTTSVPALLRRDVADSIPFSTDRFADVVARFAPASLAMAGEIRWALDACEHPRPLPGEKAGCATSLEALVEFPVAALGTRHVRAFSAAMPVEAASAGAARGRYNVTALRKISDSSQIVTCHDMTYPYAVFYCHTTNPTRAYVVRLEPEDGAAPAMEALAVCHLDTSLWSPKHPYFQAHRDVKPGGAPACHFLTKLSIIWVPAGEARAVQ